MSPKEVVAERATSNGPLEFQKLIGDAILSILLRENLMDQIRALSKWIEWEQKQGDNVREVKELEKSINEKLKKLQNLRNARANIPSDRLGALQKMNHNISEKEEELKSLELQMEEYADVLLELKELQKMSTPQKKQKTSTPTGTDGVDFENFVAAWLSKEEGQSLNNIFLTLPKESSTYDTKLEIDAMKLESGGKHTCLEWTEVKINQGAILCDIIKIINLIDVINSSTDKSVTCAVKGADKSHEVHGISLSNLTYVVRMIEKTLEQSIIDSMRSHVISACAKVSVQHGMDVAKIHRDFLTEQVTAIMLEEKPLYTKAIEEINVLLSEGRIKRVRYEPQTV